MVERVSSLIGSSASSSVKVDPEAQVSQVCAKVLSAMTVLEVFFKSEEGELFKGKRRCAADVLL
jgi:hypothetical protein